MDSNEAVRRIGRVGAILPISVLALFLFVSAEPSEAREAGTELLQKASAVVAASGLQCSVTDAREIAANTANEVKPTISVTPNGGNNMNRGMGMGGMTNSGTSAGTTTLSDVMIDPGGGSRLTHRSKQQQTYEIACREGLGFIVVDNPNPVASGPPSVINCLEADAVDEKSANGRRCRLSENNDQSLGLKTLASLANITCPIVAGRGIGHSDHVTFFEIACQNGDGYVLSTNIVVRFDQPTQSVPCLAIPATAGQHCILTDASATLLALRQFVASRVQTCVPTGQRPVGTLGGKMVFEVACQSGEGYIARRVDANNFDTLLSCDDQAAVGKCSLAKKDSAH